MTRDSKSLRVLVGGATGYIGRHVVQSLLAHGHQVIALMRDDPARPDADAVDRALAGAMRADWDDLSGAGPVDVVISCIASRTGVAADAWHVDHGLNQRLLDAAHAAGARRFVLLSAICVQKPRLAFQFAKLEFEKALADSGLEYAIVRPTAYFKSLAGQVSRVQNGKPFLVFGNGALTACRPISAADLADFIAHHASTRDAANAVLPIGGPGPAITPREQGEMLFELSGRPPRFRRVPPAMFRIAHAVLRPLGVVFPRLKAKAELARIGHYYATESMLLWDAAAQRYAADDTPSYGSDTLREFYADALRNGLGGHELGAQRVFDRKRARD
ncbi:MAG: NAD(P)H-binding protein [Pseudomonadota bacterium]